MGGNLPTRAPPKDPNYREENRMSKPLWGGSAAAVALLSVSLLFYAQPSVAETLAVTASQEIQQRGEAQTEKNSGADANTTTNALADATSDKETPNNANPDTPKAAAAEA